MSGPQSINTVKTFNDPIYGFITITDPLIFHIVEHAYFQRLRRITQLGLTNLVYGGANHSRFQHALGAMNLMHNAINVLRVKGIEISPEEEQASKIAILLHDIGHGPFSHALENTIVKGIDHEAISLMVFRKLNEEKRGDLEMALQIYEGSHPKHFLHQLVSSQLDVDRLDYLKRDSFFTGVSEGVIGSERIIKMLTVVNGELAVEAKGIYSLEKFLIARRLMYWQVYLHKTVLSAEYLLMNILIRAKEVMNEGIARACSPALEQLLRSRQLQAGYSPDWLDQFLQLDDFDILFAIKRWCEADDDVLAELCQRLIHRKLLKTRISKTPVADPYLDGLRKRYQEMHGVSEAMANYLIFVKKVDNHAYDAQSENINIYYKDGRIEDISTAADIFRFASLEARETKYFLYYPKEVQAEL